MSHGERSHVHHVIAHSHTRENAQLHVCASQSFSRILRRQRNHRVVPRDLFGSNLRKIFGEEVNGDTRDLSQRLEPDVSDGQLTRRCQEVPRQSHSERVHCSLFSVDSGLTDPAGREQIISATGQETPHLYCRGQGASPESPCQVRHEGPLGARLESVFGDGAACLPELLSAFNRFPFTLSLAHQMSGSIST